ncbi:MAG TPA: amidase [Cyclobacteriaceae bacterium]|nr:amidase [Cyclobacteriaceae bacterium]
MIRQKYLFFLAGALFISLSAASQVQRPAIDRDLEEVTIPRLHELYAAHQYTVSEVTQWYLDRVSRYDSVYKAVLYVDKEGAMATAAAMDAAFKNGARNFSKGSLWGIPIVIKANMSAKGLITSAGWKGYMIPGHELIANNDATVVAKLKAAGAVIIGQTNMPDFAASDTNLSSAGGRTGNAYDWRFSPGGSSGGTVTAVAANFAVAGTGTDTGNSIRMPSATSSLVGVLPTRGLTSIWGIQPLDWLLDNAGPIARNVTDASVLLDVMAGEDPHDFRTKGALKVEMGSFAKSLDKRALKGKRFGVPAFMTKEKGWGLLMQPETRAAFMKALDGLRAAGATVVIDSTILPDSFPMLVRKVDTAPYLREGADNYLRDFGTMEYQSVEGFEKVTGTPIPGYVVGVFEDIKDPLPQRRLEDDPDAPKLFWAPQKAALDAYEEPLNRLHLDAYVYPAIQMPPNDETIPQPDGEPSSGPHSWTAWANVIGVPAIVVPGGFYSNGLPFGLEISTRRWKDRDLLSWAFAYEQATKHRKPPLLVDKK